MAIDKDKVTKLVEAAWEDSIVPSLFDYIRIPAKSPHFDSNWADNGHIEKAVALISDWSKAQKIDGLKLEVHRLKGRTPLIFMDIPGEGDDCVVLYGHYDKQPEMTGWSEGFGPWEPVRKDDKLFGRGGADDGYAAYASLTAIRALREAGGRHNRCVVIIEGCEESGSYDLPFYIDALKDKIGNPSLVVCLDSGCGNYEQLWCTTSLRGLAAGELTVKVLTEGVHSGDASGLVPSSFRIARLLLSRLEDPETGRILPKEFHVDIPRQRQEQAEVCGRILDGNAWRRFPWANDGMRAMASDPTEVVLNRTWRPFLSTVGAAGMPSLENAGNVLRPFTTLKLSLRVPPTGDAQACTDAMKRILEKDPPYGAEVTFKGETGANGWNAPALSPWLERSCDSASRAFFGKECVYMGEGGTIPFMGMLGAKFPEAQFMITGLLGPRSNAHGPNEFLHIPMGKKLTACVTQVIDDHFHRNKK